MADLEDFDHNLFLKGGALWAHEGRVHLFWGDFKTQKIRPDQPAIAVCDFFVHNSIDWLIYPNHVTLDSLEAQEFFFHQDFEIHWQEPDLTHFRIQFEQAQKLFHQSDLKKIVPYVFENSDFKLESSHLSSMIRKGLGAKQGYLYGHWHNGQGFLGLSPELLVGQTDEHHFQTMALAGTVSLKSYEDNPHEFLNDQKQKIEHDWVVDDLKEQLKDLGTLKVETARPQKAVSLVHWLTPIELKCEKKISLEDLVLKLHPTPALGSYPRDKNLNIFKEWNQLEPRLIFGAPFGFSESPKRAKFIVAIRNIMWDQNSLKIGSGCGVVRESDFDKEWREIKDKRNAVKKVFFNNF